MKYAQLVAEASCRQFGYKIKLSENQQNSAHSAFHGQTSGNTDLSGPLERLSERVPRSILDSMQAAADKLCETLGAVEAENKRTRHFIGMIQNKLDYHNMCAGRKLESVHPLRS
jgi:hypothetical protein